MFRRFVAATMIGALALTTGCGLHNPFTSKAEPVIYESVAQSELSPEQKVDKLVANMSDADKVGQLLMIGIHGTTLNDDAKFMLNEYRVGGIILFDRNMESKDQVKTLITDINKAGKSAGLTPLFLGIDRLIYLAQVDISYLFDVALDYFSFTDNMTNSHKMKSFSHCSIVTPMTQVVPFLRFYNCRSSISDKLTNVVRIISICI